MRRICVCLLVWFVTACATATKPTLYEHLGGNVAITKLVDGLLVKIEQDPRIVHHFKDTDIARFRSKLIEQLCQVSDGPCQYTGSTMQESHTGFQITAADFDRLLQHLIDVMTDLKIPLAAQNDLLARLAPMYKDVTYR